MYRSWIRDSIAGIETQSNFMDFEADEPGGSDAYCFHISSRTA